MHDLRYALRTLRNRPAFALAAVLTLAIATGANTAIFTVFYQVLLRPLPYREPDRLVFVWNAWKNGSHTNVSIRDNLIPLVEGRFFNDADTGTAPRVVVVDELLARRQFPVESALGRQLNFGSPRNYTIVGVVGAINRGDLSKAVLEERIYFNVQQVPQRTMGVLVKSRMDAAPLTPLLCAAVQTIDSDQAVFEVRTLDERLSRALKPRRTPALLFAVFATIALLLAAVGIYGVLSSSVAERVREFGIRQALGADRAAILRLVLRQGLATACAGILAGAVGSCCSAATCNRSCLASPPTIR